MGQGKIGGGGSPSGAAATPIFGTVTGGAANTLVMATPSSPVTSYIDGGKYIFMSDVDIPGGSTTLNISGVGAVNLETHLTINPSDGDLKADTVYELVYILADNTFYLSAFVLSEVTTYNNYVIVKSVTDFPTPSVGIITLAVDTTYFINGFVDIGTNEIVLNEDNVFMSFASTTGTLTGTTIGTLITGNISNGATFRNINIECPNGQIFDIDGNEGAFITMDFVTSFNCTTIGNLTDIFSLVIKAGFAFFTNGITFSGTFDGGVTFTETAFIVFTGTAFDLDTATVQSFKMSNCSWAGIGGSSTDMDGLTNSGNILTGGAAIITGCDFSTTGTILNNITPSDLQWDFENNRGVINSTVSTEAQVLGNSTTTVMHAQNARVIMNVTGVTGEESSRITVGTDGVSIFNAIENEVIKFDGNILLEPASSTKQISCQFVSIGAAQTVVTFTNATNLINDTGTPLVDGDQITFKDNAGTLPAELFDNVIYYVVNQVANAYQVEYEPGDGAITFSTDGSGTNSYRLSDLHGSLPSTPIAANSPRNLVPQALHTLITDDETTVVLINEDDGIDIDVKQAYYRMTM